ncbi:hypothetical protein BB560_003584 [Smittium megazygosporum]|uniref:Elongator complex protein 5 n=1 Tax=Smittium megazygosporum TaxID=133381 RepID=A0A2T9ZBN2_9FUNG|nr:hypothetical protein BB560_003584 [Smittium megazygosporum]
MEPTIPKVLGNNLPSSNMLLIQDCLRNNGAQFVKTCIRNEIARGKCIILVSTKLDPKLFIDFTGENKIIDLRITFSLRPANDKNPILENFNLDLEDLYSKIENILNHGRKYVVVFDSLERFLMKSVSDTIKFFQKLKAIITGDKHVIALHHSEPSEYNYKSSSLGLSNASLSRSKSVANKYSVEVMFNAVFTLYHADMLKIWMMPGWFEDEKSSKAQIISNSSSSISSAKKPFELDSAVYDCDGLILMEQKKAGGKVKRELCQYNIIRNMLDFKFLNTKEMNKENEKDLIEELNQDVSFNLILTDKQKKDKDNVHLPYMDAQNDSGGTITYQPDTDDDWDEDDPDDDLDF